AKKHKHTKQDAKSQQLAREVGVAGEQPTEEFPAQASSAQTSSAEASPAEAISAKGKFRMTPTMGNRWVRLVRKMPGVVMAFVVLSWALYPHRCWAWDCRWRQVPPRTPIPRSVRQLTCYPLVFTLASTDLSWSSWMLKTSTLTQQPCSL